MGLIFPKSEMESLQSSVAKPEISLQTDLVWKFHTGRKMPPPAPAKDADDNGIHHRVPGGALCSSQEAAALWLSHCCVRGSAGCWSHYPSAGAKIEENPAAYLGDQEEVEDIPFLPCPIPIFPLSFTLFGDWAQRCWLCEERGDLKGKCCFKAEIITASLSFSFFLFPAGLLLVQRKGGL